MPATIYAGNLLREDRAEEAGADLRGVLPSPEVARALDLRSGVVSYVAFAPTACPSCPVCHDTLRKGKDQDYYCDSCRTYISVNFFR